MKRALKQIWNEDEGVLTFEWILLITVLVIGIVGGLSAARDAILDELGDVAGAVVAVDQSYTVETDACSNLGNAFGFQDSLPTCQNGTVTPGRARSTTGITQTLTECGN